MQRTSREMAIRTAAVLLFTHSPVRRGYDGAMHLPWDEECSIGHLRQRPLYETAGFRLGGRPNPYLHKHIPSGGTNRCISDCATKEICKKIRLLSISPWTEPVYDNRSTTIRRCGRDILVFDTPNFPLCPVVVIFAASGHAYEQR